MRESSGPPVPGRWHPSRSRYRREPETSPRSRRVGSSRPGGFHARPLGSRVHRCRRRGHLHRVVGCRERRRPARQVLRHRVSNRRDVPRSRNYLATVRIQCTATDRGGTRSSESIVQRGRRCEPTVLAFAKERRTPNLSLNLRLGRPPTHHRGPDLESLFEADGGEDADVEDVSPCHLELHQGSEVGRTED